MGEQMTDAVLVTGAFGLVGTATVKHLAAQGRHVVATDLDTPANRRSASTLPAGVRVHWADLTDPEQVGALLAATTPASSAFIRRTISSALSESIASDRGLRASVSRWSSSAMFVSFGRTW